MSISLLYHALGDRGNEYVRTEYRNDQVMFTVDQERKALRCAACGSRDVQPCGRVERRFRSLPIGSRATILVFPMPLVACRACGVGHRYGSIRSLIGV